jgi:hypothetical protein
LNTAVNLWFTLANLAARLINTPFNMLAGLEQVLRRLGFSELDIQALYLLPPAEVEGLVRALGEASKGLPALLRSRAAIGILPTASTAALDSKIANVVKTMQAIVRQFLKLAPAKDAVVAGGAVAEAAMLRKLDILLHLGRPGTLEVGPILFKNVETFRDGDKLIVRFNDLRNLDLIGRDELITGEVIERPAGGEAGNGTAAMKSLERAVERLAARSGAASARIEAYDIVNSKVIPPWLDRLGFDSSKVPLSQAKGATGKFGLVKDLRPRP